MANVVLVDHDPAWLTAYGTVRSELDAALADWPHNSEHFGSTVVPSLAAKPVIDVLLGVADEDVDATALLAAIEALAFTPVPIRTGSRRRVLVRRQVEGHHDANVHVVVYRGDVWRGLSLFRDLLATDPDAAREYNVVKRQLVEADPSDWRAYRAGKREFMLSAEPRAHALFRQSNPGEKPPSFQLSDMAYSYGGDTGEGDGSGGAGSGEGSGEGDGSGSGEGEGSGEGDGSGSGEGDGSGSGEGDGSGSGEGEGSGSGSDPGTSSTLPPGIVQESPPDDIESSEETSDAAFAPNLSKPLGNPSNPHVAPGVVATQDADGNWIYGPGPGYQSVGEYEDDDGEYWIFPELTPPGAGGPQDPQPEPNTTPITNLGATTWDEINTIDQRVPVGQAAVGTDPNGNPWAYDHSTEPGVFYTASPDYPAVQNVEMGDMQDLGVTSWDQLSNLDQVVPVGSVATGTDPNGNHWIYDHTKDPGTFTQVTQP
jgi:GrpB-like predicted nucleotidyltransferase (UPF0157 family)